MLLYVLQILGSTKMLSFFELDVKEAIRALVSLINILHHRIGGQNFLSIHEKCDGCLFAQAHSFSNNLMELNSLEVVWNQEPVTKQTKMVNIGQTNNF